MRSLSAALAASAWIGAVQAQGAPPATSAPPPAQRSPGQTAAPSAQPPKRGYIAPILDIRIEGEGVSLPKPGAEAPLEKSPAK